MSDVMLNQAARHPVHTTSIAYQVYGSDAVLIDTDQNIVRMLNQTATRVWQLIDGTRSVSDIASVLVAEFDISDEQATRSVQRLLGDFAEKKLIAWV